VIHSGLRAANYRTPNRSSSRLAPAKTPLSAKTKSTGEIEHDRKFVHDQAFFLSGEGEHSSSGHEADRHILKTAARRARRLLELRRPFAGSDEERARISGCSSPGVR
jgi:hypothetical protein